MMYRDANKKITRIVLRIITAEFAVEKFLQDRNGPESTSKCRLVSKESE
jgi:hypothetical protein